MVSRAVYVITLLLACSVLLAAQTNSGSQGPASEPQTSTKKIKQVPASYTNPSSGKEMYVAYCASCHGEAGRGDGPAATALKTQPTNLTLLAAKNHGSFPSLHVVEIIRGDKRETAHGSKQMPIWGPVFLHMGHQNQGQEELRIHNLTMYLESIQQQ